MSAAREPTARPAEGSLGENRVVVLRKRDDRTDWLCRQVAGNRFLPIPEAERVFVGDGDFRAIGAEFLGHFIRLGGLLPEEEVLELGCGIGRMAIPLTQYLTTGRYDGVDVVADGIDWCRSHVTAAYDNFRFHHLDVANELYNPAGKLDGATIALPFPDASFGFVILTSVVTHLRTAEVMRYAVEIGRLLRPGGRAFLSLFLMDETARAGVQAGRARQAFQLGTGPEYLGDLSAPNAAVAFDQSFLLGLFASQGLRPAQPIRHGHWSGREGPRNYQDLLVLTREAQVGGVQP